MEPEIVKNYAHHIQRLNPDFILLRNLREGKQKASGNKLGVKTPIKREDYLGFFDNYQVRELNVIPFGYKTVDGFNSELMLLEKNEKLGNYTCSRWIKTHSKKKKYKTF